MRRSKADAHDYAAAPTRGAPVVSVVIIFLDAVRYIEEAIRSVQSQTLSSWELVLVDDGSTDGSRELADRFAAAYPDRIRVLQHPARKNRGTGPSEISACQRRGDAA
jgi:glycosyltransferase involved in cell wall biosynthesis